MKRVVLPLILSLTLSASSISRPIAIRGIAVTDNIHWEQDRVTLNSAWWFDWKSDTALDDPTYVPTAWWGQVLPFCPSVELFGNEWNINGYDAWGLFVSPVEAVNRYLAAKAACPNTKFIVGNVSADDWSDYGGMSGVMWIRAFLREYRRVAGHPYTDGLGVHGYGSSSYCISRLSSMRRAYNGEMWVSEFSTMSTNTRDYSRLLTYMSRKFTHIAAFTNRLPADCMNLDWCRPFADRNVELVREDGTLTPIGNLFAGR